MAEIQVTINGEPVTDLIKLGMLAQSSASGDPVQIEYTDREGTVTHREVEVTGFKKFQSGEVAILGFDTVKKAYRTFNVHSIEFED